jgi:hypothetical protein
LNVLNTEGVDGIFDDDNEVDDKQFNEKKEKTNEKKSDLLDERESNAIVNDVIIVPTTPKPKNTTYNNLVLTPKKYYLISFKRIRLHFTRSN